MTGLPCTGKTTLAGAIAQVLPAAALSADPIDDALVRAGMSLEHRPDIAGYAVMKALAREQLALGLSAVIDAVNPFVFVRDEYAAMARDASTPMVVIETVCSDPVLHRQRVEDRQRRGIKAITWDGVEHQQRYYEPHTSDVLRLDSVEPIDRNVALALAHVARSR